MAQFPSVALPPKTKSASAQQLLPSPSGKSEKGRKQQNYGPSGFFMGT
jgi:hypothetical protein